MGTLYFESKGKGQALSAQAMLGQLHEALVEAGKNGDQSVEVQVAIRGSKEVILNYPVKDVDELLSIIELSKD
ncbi:hypothetical protein P3T18_000787 [Paraburkholderia sp. GAS199]|uniref:hypothetical protein n=1 Tax=Paraburkholderia sp. GAS199 TaxID=3035126 RepID=UPI003D2118FE